MPRQILPGLQFKQWVPSPEMPIEQHKDYVFPELVIGDEIPDDRWNDWAWIGEQPEAVQHKRVLRETLDQLLYNSIIWMMNNDASSITTENHDQFVKDLLDLRIAHDDPYKTFAVECIIRRVAACYPSGHYVWK